MVAPQRVYLPSGPLGDQVTYPQRFREGVDAVRALEALRCVGLEYILTDRAGDRGWHFDCTWEAVLSGGEQQRLALARLFFHRPRIALLDECTSMVAVDKEDQRLRIVPMFLPGEKH
eukprot:4331116-Amphidinium_carterae.1